MSKPFFILFIISVFSNVFAVPCLSGLCKRSTKTTFRAAVYEHAIILPVDRQKVVSRADAVGLMMKNLAVYETQAAEARRQVSIVLN